MLPRLFTHCLIRPEDLPPSQDNLQVVGTFNPGAAAIDGQVILMVRVVEYPRESREGFTALPRYENGRVEVDHIRNDELYLVDPRVVRRRSDGWSRLTFVSHLRVFRGRLSEPSKVLPDPVRFVP